MAAAIANSVRNGSSRIPQFPSTAFSSLTMSRSIQERHAFAIGEAIARKNIRKNYYLETRGDVLLKNKEVFKF